MKLLCFVSFALSLAFVPADNAYSRSNQSSAQIKNAIIKESIASYPGNCPCPYHSARNGSSCGKRSAYSRAGGYSVMCYPADVSDEMVRSYRQRGNT